MSESSAKKVLTFLRTNAGIAVAGRDVTTLAWVANAWQDYSRDEHMATEVAVNDDTLALFLRWLRPGGRDT